MKAAIDIRTGERGDEFVPLKVIDDQQLGVYVRPGNLMEITGVLGKLQKMGEKGTTILPKHLENALVDLVENLIDRFNSVEIDGETYGFISDGDEFLEADAIVPGTQLSARRWLAEYIVTNRTLRAPSQSWGMRILQGSLGLAEFLSGNSSAGPAGTGATAPAAPTKPRRSTAKRARKKAPRRKKTK